MSFEAPRRLGTSKGSNLGLPSRAAATRPALTLPAFAALGISVLGFACWPKGPATTPTASAKETLDSPKEQAPSDPLVLPIHPYVSSQEHNWCWADVSRIITEVARAPGIAQCEHAKVVLPGCEQCEPPASASKECRQPSYPQIDEPFDYRATCKLLPLRSDALRQEIRERRRALGVVVHYNNRRSHMLAVYGHAASHGVELILAFDPEFGRSSWYRQESFRGGQHGTFFHGLTYHNVRHRDDDADSTPQARAPEPHADGLGDWKPENDRPSDAQSDPDSAQALQRAIDIIRHIASKEPRSVGLEPTDDVKDVRLCTERVESETPRNDEARSLYCVKGEFRGQIWVTKVQRRWVPTQIQSFLVKELETLRNARAELQESERATAAVVYLESEGRYVLRTAANDPGAPLTPGGKKPTLEPRSFSSPYKAPYELPMSRDALDKLRLENELPTNAVEAKSRFGVQCSEWQL